MSGARCGARSRRARPPRRQAQPTSRMRACRSSRSSRRTTSSCAQSMRRRSCSPIRSGPMPSRWSSPITVTRWGWWRAWMWRRRRPSSSPRRRSCSTSACSAPSSSTRLPCCWARPRGISRWKPSRWPPCHRPCPRGCPRTCWNAAPISRPQSAAWPLPMHRSAWRRLRGSRARRSTHRMVSRPRPQRSGSRCPAGSGRSARPSRKRSSMAASARRPTTRSPPRMTRVWPTTGRRC